MLKTIFQNMAIRHKLTAIIMLTSILALSLVLSAIAIREYMDAREKMVADFFAYATIIADNSKAAIAFTNKADAENILSALRATRAAVFACIYDKDRKVFVKYQRSDITESIRPPEPQEEGFVFKGGYLFIFKKVILDNETIGTIYLQAELSEIYEDLLRDSITSIIIAGVVLLLAYFFSSKLQKVVSDPILILAEAAKFISEKKDYSIRAAKTSSDELGLLTNAFNKMLEQIQQRDLALTNSNEQLDAKVKERTADLTKEVAVRKKAEDALASLNRSLESTIQDLTRANQQLADFAHITAHDLKSPLRAIGTIADWIATDYADKFDEEGREKVRLLTGRAERMSRLIDSILVYSEAGHVGQTTEKVDLNLLLAEVIAEINPPENIEITVENKLPTLVREKTSIMQIFQGLLSNAIKYMDKPDGRIKLACVEENGFWRFSVADNGPGIEEEYFERIFKIFQTLLPRDKCESTGVGLAIVKKIIEVHGGDVWVESKIGEGSTFFFTLPKQKGEVIENAQLEANIVS